ncbi:hypothetical protein GDO86_015003 [Hymenochirus boettgeri]|uniref:ADP-ribosylation factor-like protein 13A n=1 Tax=Hymenochirus boettgeri TaxID=247094 RepID=A0A8T2JUY4_9PIPI|nr:hypothetical protein GDO86_015003 [Hymenochirus boettgeri]
MFHLFSNCWHWIQVKQKPIRKVTILFLGLDNAGKSSVIKVIKRVPPCQVLSSSHIDPHRTEICLDRFELTLLEIPGGQKSSASWRLFYSQAHALVFIVDASDPARMKEVACLLSSVLRHPLVAGKPFLIFANKQDKSSALLSSEIIELLSLESLVNENKTLCRIEPCTAGADFSSQHDWTILKGLRWVLKCVTLSYNVLNARVLQESFEKRQGSFPSLRAPPRTQDGRMVLEYNMSHENLTDLVEYKFAGGKKKPLKPIQNLLNQTGQNLRCVKKRRRKVRVKENNLINENEHDKQNERKKLNVEQKPSPSCAIKHSHRLAHKTVVLPEEEQNNQSTGPRKKKKKKIIPKNQIKSQVIGGSSEDMSNTFDLYRRAMQALKLKQEQQRVQFVHDKQGVKIVQ